MIIQLFRFVLSTGCNGINSVCKIIKHIAISLLFSDFKDYRRKKLHHL